MSEKDPWEGYSLSVDEEMAWAVPGARIIPLPAERCSDRLPDLVIKLPKNPTPYDMPVFVVDKILVGKYGRTKYVLYMEDSPGMKIERPLVDIQEKWRPAPEPQEEEPEDPVILSRYERKPVI